MVLLAFYAIKSGIVVPSGYAGNKMDSVFIKPSNYIMPSWVTGRKGIRVRNQSEMSFAVSWGLFNTESGRRCQHPLLQSQIWRNAGDVNVDLGLLLTKDSCASSAVNCAEIILCRVLSLGCKAGSAFRQSLVYTQSSHGSPCYGLEFPSKDLLWEKHPVLFSFSSSKK